MSGADAIAGVDGETATERGEGSGDGSRRWFVLLACLAVVAAGFVVLLAVGGGEDSKAVDSRVGREVVARSGGGVVLAARRQAVADGSVVVDRVVLAEPGYVGLYEDGAGAPGRLWGSSELLEKGEHRDVRVKVTGDVGTGAFLVVHVEDNGNRSLDFPSGDAPVGGESGVPVVRIDLVGDK